MLTQVAARLPPGGDEEPQEITEEDPRFEVGVVVRLPESTFGLDRIPTTPTADVAGGEPR
eukprot:1109482-Lingulodinium_polyedra.AAC.1